MNDLVVMVNGVPMVDSVLVAKKFNKDHRQVLDAVRRIETDAPEFWRANFCASTYKVRGKDYCNYLLTRDGFSLVAMGFTGTDALKWKVAYINAFNAMETALSKKDDAIEWKQARLQSKAIRQSVTDTIKEFVDYATKQGSSSASRYYCSITKMEYAALELIQHNQKVPSGFRDTLDAMDLCFLATAEQVAKTAIRNGMAAGMHYKEVYIEAKDRVCTFAETVKMPRVGAK